MALQFSIIIPTYNRAHLITETINSALQQACLAKEIIIVDDGSTDVTESTIRDNFGVQVRYIKTDNNERGAARNIGATMATGDYIYFLDSDDLLYSNHLREAENFIIGLGNPEWIFQEYEIKGFQRSSQVKYDRNNPLRTLITKGNFMSCHGVFLRRDIALKHPFNEDRELSGSEDYALWLKLAARYTLYTNPIVTSALVQHDQRSVFNFQPDALIQRKLRMLDLVLEDVAVRETFANWMPQLKSNTYSYIALHLAMLRGAKKNSLKWWLKSIYAAPASIADRRSLAILKHLLFG